MHKMRDRTGDRRTGEGEMHKMRDRTGDRRKEEGRMHTGRDRTGDREEIEGRFMIESGSFTLNLLVPTTLART